ncbi:hypothetical protein M23134_06925 [Microscilla marina ATCC 23134]|uniref:Uncharacterized protein n=1 Tax=Microscilla marina ATCC 23134 TaxID=313606 RepID=A1ZQB5_MICM2|nr:hypothetical protein M23134_06925 [Microscilla marina ATCC 23134]
MHTIFLKKKRDWFSVECIGSVWLVIRKISKSLIDGIKPSKVPGCSIETL